MCMEAGITTQIRMFRDFCQIRGNNKELEQFFKSLQDFDWTDFANREQLGISHRLTFLET